MTCNRFIKCHYIVSFVAEEVEEKLSLEADSKVFFFDIGENQYGDYLRISEVFIIAYVNTATAYVGLLSSASLTVW